jgi:hypothetical protein
MILEVGNNGLDAFRARCRVLGCWPNHSSYLKVAIFKESLNDGRANISTRLIWLSRIPGFWIA